MSARRPARIVSFIFVALLSLSMVHAPPRLLAQESPRADLLVDAETLAGLMGTPGVVVVHVARNAEAAAEAELIPGSSLIHLDEISRSSNEGGYREALDLPDDLASARAVFERAGVSDDSRVILTWGEGRFPNATRAAWTLEVLGKSEGVSILDGGVEAWRADGRGTATVPATPARGRLDSAPQLDRGVDSGWVLRNGRADGVALLDGRMTPSFTGERPEMPGRAGHIPGAGSLPQVDLHTEDGHLKDAEALRELFRSAGVEEGDRVVAYCHIGYWASALVFAARTLGIDARLYDGSMTEWAQDESLPLVTPGGGGN